MATRLPVLVSVVLMFACSGSSGGGGGGGGTNNGGGSSAGGTNNGGGSAQGGGSNGGGSATGGSNGGGSATGGGTATGGGSAQGGGTATGGGTAGVELNAGWIGGACTAVGDCNDSAYTDAAVCETTANGFPGGFCTQACTVSSVTSAYICPDEIDIGSGFTTTRCINANGSPQCVAECDFTQSPDTGCRPGYECVERPRYMQSTKIFAVCLPAPSGTWPGETAPANDIGSACTAVSDCANNVCLSMPLGYCTKNFCDTTGCPTGTTCYGIGSGQTACLKDCTTANDCRMADGYVCDATYHQCLPGASMQAQWDNTVGAADCTAAWGTNGSGLHSCDTTKDNYVVVHKSARNIALCNAGSLVMSYRVGLGFAPTGDKAKEGDGKTPEGTFYVAELIPNSSYYHAFLISYPDSAHASTAYAASIITSTDESNIDDAQTACGTPPQTTGAGGYVEIHGEGSSSDWTFGCVAGDNTTIDALWAVLKVHDTIVVLP